MMTCAPVTSPCAEEVTTIGPAFVAPLIVLVADASLGVRLVRRVVPAEVPSVFQSCAPVAPSFAVEYRIPPMLVRFCGDDPIVVPRGLVPEVSSVVLMSATSWAVAALEIVLRTN